MRLHDSLGMVKGVGPKNLAALQTLGLSTVADLIDYWPRRYDDYAAVIPISQLKPGLVTVAGTFSNIRSQRSRRGIHLTEALLSDGRDGVAVVWFNQPYRAASLKVGQRYIVYGNFGLKGRRMNLTNPRVEEWQDSQKSATIVPIYRENKHVSSQLLRKIATAIAPMFDAISETLPRWLIEDNHLMSRAEAVRSLHVPASMRAVELARTRLGFEEIFEMQLAGELLRAELSQETSPHIAFDERAAKEFVAALPFDLTPDQRRTVWRIYQDMNGTKPMNRLVEGDVGSGKTVVAAMAALMAMHAGYQVLLMAPTELLARQHAATLHTLLAHTPWVDQIGLLVGSLTSVQKKQLHTKIASGHCRLAIGTHALIQDKVLTDNVGLVIIDEQHRFGVEQRRTLRAKSGLYPHVLAMTATPIPRTLALTLYGEIDITQLKSMPRGERRITTEIVPPSQRASLYARLQRELDTGRQAYVVCPLIESNPLLVAPDVTSMAASLQKVFQSHSVGVLHGDMRSTDKNAVMQAFACGEVDVLVSTTVIEVGVDVPNATVMILEGAERFGLAQIHQLRGRVGRGEHGGMCFLVPSEDAIYSKRLSALTHISDGFRLSEIDLELRGPGAIYGLQQSGVLDLRLARLSDESVIRQARLAAQSFVARGEDLLHYPELAAKVHHFCSIRNLH
jgi:ATP-dependent DNA helicase RecG